MLFDGIVYLAAFVIFGHGIGHLVGPIAAFGVKIQGTKDEPWLLPGGHRMTSKIGRAWSVFWFASVVLFLISSIGAFTGESWWREWAVVGSVVSIVAMGPWWKSLLFGAKLGVVLDIAILLIVPFSWGQGIVDLFGLP